MQVLLHGASPGEAASARGLIVLPEEFPDPHIRPGASDRYYAGSIQTDLFPAGFSGVKTQISPKTLPVFRETLPVLRQTMSVSPQSEPVTGPDFAGPVTCPFADPPGRGALNEAVL